jgi:predicted ArsR family transcriptional regulator
MTTMDSLETLGLTGPEESVYRLLLSHPGSSVSDLSQRLGAGRHSIRSAIAGLERLGLVSNSPSPQSLYFPAAPDAGLEALILRRQADLEQARNLAKRLMTDYREGSRAQPPDLIEIVTGAEAMHRRFEELQRGARHLVQVLDTPPYVGPGGTPNQVEFEALARGVVYRGIYDRAALEAAPGTINAIARYVAAGEQARFLPGVPFKLAIFDREFACVPLEFSQPDLSRCMVVRHCSLLDALFYIFDTLWARATPITFGPDGPAPDHRAEPAGAVDSRLLALLAAGLTDKAVARHLEVSYSTARRHIAALMEGLGAETRFQAGLQAGRKGWL